MEGIINMLGDAKISFAALIPTALERSEMNVLCTTRKHTQDGINNCVTSGMCDFEYPIKFFKSDEGKLSDAYGSMLKNNIRVGIVPDNSELFIEMIKNGDGGIWFSACREGLYKTYLPIMEKFITKPTNIFVFDNDETIVKKARENCRNPNLKIFKCIVHSVCSEIKYDYAKGIMYLTCGKECLLVFPPDAPNLSGLFKTNPIFGRAEVKFTTSNEAFHYYVMWKPIGINAMHTLASVKAYVVGSKMGYSLTEIASKGFYEFLSKEDLLAYVIKVYSLLYEKHLAPYAETVSADKDTYVAITQRFICGLYDMNETIGRGIDPTHSSFESKIKQHFSLLKSSGDNETINLLNEFLEIL